jgi:hypothetical protein
MKKLLPVAAMFTLVFLSGCGMLLDEIAGEDFDESRLGTTEGGGGNGSSGSLSAPTGLKATVSGNIVTLSWDSASGATGYKVYRNTSESGTYTFLANASGTSYTDSGLAAGTYYYKVSAVSSGGSESPQSSSASTAVTGSSSGGGLSAPTGLNASASGNDVTLTWNSASGASFYRIYRSTSASGSYGYIGFAYTVSYTDSGLSTGTTYYYKVTAVSSTGSESPQSSYASATVTGGGNGEGEVPATSLQAALDWLDSNAAQGGAYTITLQNNEAIAPRTLSYGGKNVSVTLRGSTTGRTVRKCKIITLTNN